MSFEEFKKIYSHLFKIQIIDKETLIGLFNWGEPMLNKEYSQIVSFLSRQGQPYEISTNASVVRLLDECDAYKHCTQISFSMPGFSQESYDKIHGLSFEKIKGNILKIVENARECGFKGVFAISFHVYKFNTREIKGAKRFAEAHGICFRPKYAYLNGGSIIQQFFENRLSDTDAKDAEDELFLSFVKSLVVKRPKGYQCSGTLTLDWDGSIWTCCCDDIDKWGSIYDINSFEEMQHLRKKIFGCEFCRKCREYGIDYWLGNQPEVDMQKYCRENRIYALVKRLYRKIYPM